MISSYTAKHGTTFQFDPAGPGCVNIIGPGEEGTTGLTVNVDDLGEFLEHIQQPADASNDGDAAAVSAD